MMRRDTIVGMLAGSVSTLPLLAYIIEGILPRAWGDFGSVLARFPTLARHAEALLVATSFLLILTYVALGLFLGAIAGLVFVGLVNRLPVRSTYIKAIVPSIVIWALPVFFVNPSQVSITGYVIRSLPIMGLFVFDATIFSYLFDRWKNKAKVVIETREKIER